MNKPRVTLGLRNRARRRQKDLRIILHDEEIDLLHSVARMSDEFTATWARDILLSRALNIHNQRHLIDTRSNERTSS